MRHELRMPQLGMMMLEGTLVRWLVEDGGLVKEGQDVLEIESDKVVQTVPAPSDGIVRQAAHEDQVVPVLEILGYVENAEIAEEETTGTSNQEAVAPVPAVVTESPPRSAGQTTAARATPIARRLAREHQVDLASLSGSGPGGRIVESDVLAVVEARNIQIEPGVQQRIPLSGRRGVIARRMMASLAERAQLTIVRQVDAQALVSMRQALVEKASDLGVRVTYDAIVAKILATALADLPILNARVDSDEILVLDQVNVGIAVSTPEGLVVPVICGCQARSLIDIAAAIGDVAKRALDGQLRPDEMSGGTVTISNMGVFGVDLFTPILNPPESAILGMGCIAPRPFVVDGQLNIRPTLHLCLTWDHRVADGAEAGALLGRVAALAQDADFLSGLA